MPRRPTTASSGDFDGARLQLEQWRRQPGRGRRIPERLWALAVKLARRHGVSKTSQALRLDYYSLKSRVEAAPRGRRRGGGRGQADGQFVELPVCAVAGTSACVVEFEDRRGRKLRMELQGLGAGELVTLARSLWSEGR